MVSDSELKKINANENRERIKKLNAIAELHFADWYKSKGLSGTEIAQKVLDEFGITTTRAAVLGKLNRMGLSKLQGKGKTDAALSVKSTTSVPLVADLIPIAECIKKEAPKKAPKVEQDTPNSTIEAAELFEDPVKEKPLKPTYTRKHKHKHKYKNIVDIRNDECKFYVSGSGKDTLFCALPVKGDHTSYCEEHFKVMYVKVRVRNRDEHMEERVRGRLRRQFETGSYFFSHNYNYGKFS